MTTYEGGYFNFIITAFDDRNQQTSRNVPIVVESSPYLQEVYVSNDRIWDVRDGKLLTAKTVEYRPPGYSTDYNMLTDYKIIDFTTGSTMSIPFAGGSYSATLNPSPHLVPDREEENVGSFLTATGVIFVGHDNARVDLPPINSNVYDFNNGVLETASAGGYINIEKNIKAAGNFAVWRRLTATNTQMIYRNLLSKTNLVLSQTGSGLSYPPSFGLAKNGLLSMTENWTNQDEIIHYLAGNYSVVSDTLARLRSELPITDGSRSVYRKNINSTNAAIVLFDGNTNVELSTMNGKNPQPRSHYQINENYVTFLRPGPSGQLQVWLRLNNGVEKQLTFFNNDNEIKKLTSNGTVFFARNFSSPYLGTFRLFSTDTSTVLKNISSSRVGRVFESNDSMYLAIGRVLYKIKLNLVPNIIVPFAKDVKKDSLKSFTVNDFKSNFSGDGNLLFLKIDSLPKYGQLLLDGTTVLTQGMDLSRLEIPRLSYRPATGFSGVDSFVWRASNGVNFTSMTAAVNLNVFAPLSQPTVTGIIASYCNNQGIQRGKITNLPTMASGITVEVKLDTTVLPVAADSTFSFDVGAILAGPHTIEVVYTNAGGSKTTNINFTSSITVSPDVSISANVTTIINSNPVLITASNASGGGVAPLYTFALDRNFSTIVQAEGSNNVLFLDPALLVGGDNWVYGRMRTSESCYTVQSNVDSIKLVKILPPVEPTISGLSAEYCNTMGAQYGKITNLPATGSGITVEVKLDATVLPVAADSTFTIVPYALSGGAHAITVKYTNVAGAKTTTYNFTNTAAIMPDVNLSSSITNIVNLTVPVIVTATNATGGGAGPLYTFGKNRDFTALWQAEGSSNTLTITPSTLTVGDNWIYVRMKSNAVCISNDIGLDSIKLTRDMSTGITDPDNPGKVISLYPNPFNKQVYISGLSAGKSYMISVTSLSGQLIHQIRISNRTNAELYYKPIKLVLTCLLFMMRRRNYHSEQLK